MATETYNIASDFTSLVGALPYMPDFEAEIRAASEAGLVSKFEYAELIPGGAPTDCLVTLSTALTAPELAELDAIVAAHVGYVTPPTPPGPPGQPNGLADQDAGGQVPLSQLQDFLSTAYQQTLFVGKHGDDSNDGLLPGKAFLTFGAAVAAANALTPTDTTRVAVVCFDAGNYDENNLQPVEFVSIYAPHATMQPTSGAFAIIQIGAAAGNGRFVFHRCVVGAGQSVLSNIGGSGLVVFQANEIVLTSNASGLSASGGTGEIRFIVDHIDAQQGFGVITSGTATARIVLKCGRINLGAAGTYGILSLGTNPISADIDYMDSGLGVGVLTAIGAVDIYVTSKKIDAAAVYQINSGTLHLLAHELSGTRSVAGTGTADVTEVGVFPADGEYVLRPGGVASGSTYTDWASLYQALQLRSEPKVITFDDSLAAIVIPSGTYDMSNTTWKGPSNDAQRVVVTVQEGAVLQQLRRFENFLTVDFVGSTPPMADFTGTDIVQAREGVILQCSGTGPLMQTSLVGPANIMGVFLLGGQLVNNGNAVFDLNNAAAFGFIGAVNQASIDENAISGLVGSICQVQVDDVSSSIKWAHAGFLGTFLPKTTYSQFKSGEVLAAVFAGSPFTAAVTFPNYPMVDDQYHISFQVETTNGATFFPTFTNRTSAGFTINLNTNDKTDLLRVTWGIHGRYPDSSEI